MFKRRAPRRIRSPFRYWLDDTVNKTVRYANDYPWLYAAAVWIPTFLFVVLFKLLKFELLADLTTTAVDDRTLFVAFRDHGIIPVLIAGAAFASGLVVQGRIASRGYFLLPVTVLSFVGIALAVKYALQAHPFWISSEFLLVTQSDLLAVGVVVAVTAGCIALLRGLILRLFLVVVQVCALALTWLAGFDFGYFFQTGSIADSFMLHYSLTHIGDLRHAVGNQFDGTTWVLFLVPLLLLFLPMALANRRRKRVHVHSYSWRMKRGFMLTGLLATGFFATASYPVPVSFATLRTSAPVELISELMRREEGVEPVALGRDALAWPTRPFGVQTTDSSSLPNIVFIIAESARSRYSGDVSFEMVMPFIDSLRAHSMDVEDLSVVVPHTNKALVPMLCGVFPELKQTASRSVTDSCLPQVLSKFGYKSSFFTTATLEFERKGEMLESMGFTDVMGDGDFDADGMTRVNYFGFEDNAILEPSSDWIKRQVKSQTPFLATFLTVTAHHDYRLPASWKSRQYSEGRMYNRYLNALAYQDQFIRDVFVRLGRLGVLDDTIVVIVSDHGEAFGEHGLSFHSAVPYQEVVSVPGMIFAPSYVPSGNVSGARQQIDLLPTLLDLLKVEYDSEVLPGRSFFLPADSSRQMYMSGWIENQSMVFREGSRKYVYHFRRRPIELFDLATDPDEALDLGGQLTDEEIAQVERRLLTWRQHVNQQYRDASTPGDD